MRSKLDIDDYYTRIARAVHRVLGKEHMTTKEFYGKLEELTNQLRIGSLQFINLSLNLESSGKEKQNLPPIFKR